MTGLDLTGAAVKSYGSISGLFKHGQKQCHENRRENMIWPLPSEEEIYVHRYSKAGDWTESSPLRIALFLTKINTFYFLVSAIAFAMAALPVVSQSVSIFFAVFDPE